AFPVLQQPLLPRSNFTQRTTKFDKASVPFRLLPLFPSQDFVDFGKHEQGSPAIELGQHRRFLSNQARQANQDSLLLAAAPDRPRLAPLVRDKARHTRMYLTGSDDSESNC